jgi:hypothetical protein
MKIINLIVQISIEDDVEEKCFDYKLKYEGLEDFIEDLFDQIETEPDSLDVNGYSIDIMGDTASSHLVSFSKN